MLLTGGFQIVLRDTMNFAAAVLTSVPRPSKMHKVPKQARDGGRVEPGPIDPRAALQVQKRTVVWTCSSVWGNRPRDV